MNTSYDFEIKKHLIKIPPKLFASKIKGVDLVYLINLDQRPEKLERTLRQLFPYQIYPNRVPAIYGWTLQDSVFQDVGLKYQKGMERVASHVLRTSGPESFSLKNPNSAIFYPRMTLGAVGTALSHLSILQHAITSNFQRIWVLEDDVIVQSDPHLLSNMIDKLSALVGCDGWDILYTDDVNFFEPFTPGTVYRPDMPDVDFEAMFERKSISPEFYKIGGRCQAHSMIIQRSGIQKIFDFAMRHGIYLPYDVEIAFVPGMRFFNLKHPVVFGGTLANSDTITKYF